MDKTEPSHTWEYTERKDSCEHCPETEGLHKYDGDKLCDTHLQKRLAHI